LSDRPLEDASEGQPPNGVGSALPAETHASVAAPASEPLQHSSTWERIKQNKIAEWTLACVAFAFAFLHGATLLSDALEWPHLIVRSVTLLLIAGAPIVPALAWYHGVRGLKRVSGSELLIIALLLAIGGSLLWLVPRPTDERAKPETGAIVAKPETKAEVSNPPAHSIAVLPFADMSEKHDQEYFADGMAEEIIEQLAKIPAIKVIGRTSSFQFKGHNEDLRAIGAKLGVAYVVEGSVRKSGDRVRVTAQLIDVNDGSHHWSESYDRDLVDVLKVQDDISVGLVRALQLSMGADEPTLRPTLKSADGYGLYLKGRQAFNRYDKPGYDQAASYFRQAMQLEPESALATAWLAYVCWTQTVYGLMPSATGGEEARRYAERARSLDPRSELAMATLGLVQMQDFDWAAGAADLDRALALAPGNARILALQSDVAWVLGQWDQAIRELNAAVTLDPLFPAGYYLIGEAQLGAGHWSDAEAAFDRAIEIAPHYAFVHFYLAKALLLKGEKQAALQQIALEPDETAQWAGRAAINHALGRKADSDAALKRLTELAAADWEFLIAYVHAYRGESDAAFLWLERAFTHKRPILFNIKSEPFLNPLKGDPRYKAFLKKMNLPE